VRQCVRRTLGSRCSWQYFSAVSEMASSSSVSKFFALRGSCQSKGRAEEAAAAKFRRVPARSAGTLRRAHLESRALDMVARDASDSPQMNRKKSRQNKRTLASQRGTLPFSPPLDAPRSSGLGLGDASVGPTLQWQQVENLGSSPVAPLLPPYATSIFGHYNVV
jgi:hypothetical protein